MKLLSFTIILNFVNAAPFLQKGKLCFYPKMLKSTKIPKNYTMSWNNMPI